MALQPYFTGIQALLKPPGEMKIGLKNRVVGEIGGKIKVFD